MLLLLEERLIGDNGLHCESSVVGAIGIPKSSTAVWEVMTAVHSADSTSVKRMKGQESWPALDLLYKKIVWITCKGSMFLLRLQISCLAPHSNHEPFDDNLVAQHSFCRLCQTACRSGTCQQLS